VLEKQRGRTRRVISERALGNGKSIGSFNLTLMSLNWWAYQCEIPITEFHNRPEATGRFSQQ